MAARRASSRAACSGLSNRPVEEEQGAGFPLVEKGATNDVQEKTRMNSGDGASKSTWFPTQREAKTKMCRPTWTQVPSSRA